MPEEIEKIKELPIKARPSTAVDEAKKALDDEVKGAKLNWDNLDVDIEHQGTKITLPKDPAKMPYDDAIAAIRRKQEDEEQEVQVIEMIDAHPLDGAVAFVRALQHVYGWASPVPKKTWFGPVPPQMITIQTGPEPGDSIQCPWGEFAVPGIENNITTTTGYTDDDRAVFQFYGLVRQREKHILKELAEYTREFVKHHSIYKGKAMRLKIGPDGMLDLSNPPQFIPIKHIRPDELILSDGVQSLVDTNLLAPIRHSDQCREAGIPLKRGILLEGPYGTGKTLISSITSKECVDNGWTYILLDKSSNLKEALYFARRYEPAVIFAEDIDRITEDRDEKANDLLNILDGVLSKDCEIMVVLTSNHAEKINKAMLRPGRLDAVISVLPPDEKAVQKLLRLYGRGLLPKNVKLEKIGEELAGEIPATIREVVERSKLAMIARKDTSLTEDDLLVSVEGMRHHLRLLNEREETEPNGNELFGIAMRKLVLEATADNQSDIIDEVEIVQGQVGTVDRKVERIIKAVS